MRSRSGTKDDPRWVRWPVTVAGAVSGGWMIVDGTRALITGDYARIDGQLGPWAELVRGVGIEPTSGPMKIIFVALGAVQLGATAGYVARRRWGRPAVALAAVGSIWYLVIGSAAAIAQLVLLAVGARRSVSGRQLTPP